MSERPGERRGVHSTVVENLEAALDRSDDGSVRYHVRQALQAERIAEGDVATEGSAAAEGGADVPADDD
jgi:hypothetical protein